MDTSATPAAPPGLGEVAGLRQAHTSHVSPVPFSQVQLANFLPNDLASAAALLQQYHLELQQQQQSTSASLASLRAAPNPQPALQQGHSRDVTAVDETNAGTAGLKENDLEQHILQEIASAAFVNNHIDLSLLSFKQRLAFVSLHAAKLQIHVNFIDASSARKAVTGTHFCVGEPICGSLRLLAALYGTVSPLGGMGCGHIFRLT